MKAANKAALASKKQVNAPAAHGVGRRKSAVARVYLRHGQGNGNVLVNGKDYTEYFDTDIAKRSVLRPFKAFPAALNYDVSANVCGGGLHAQADAICLAVSRALLFVEDTARPALKIEGLLTVDARVKERKKYGQKAARRRFQFVKR